MGYSLNSQVDVLSVRRGEAITTMRGNINEFPACYKTKKPARPRRPTATGGSHCGTMLNGVSSFLLAQLLAADASDLPYRFCLRSENKPLQSGELRQS
jgi:hypothetical protein